MNTKKKQIKLLSCLECGKILSRKQSLNWYAKEQRYKKKNMIAIGPFCSTKCAMSNSLIKEQREKTLLERYGVKNASQSNEIKNKKKKTCLKHFGCEYPYQNKEIYNKVKETCLKNNGTDNISKLENIKNIKKNKALEKYGVENVFQSDIIKEKIIHTCIEKYGVENYKKSKIELQKSFISAKRKNKHCIFLFELDDWEGCNIVKEYKVKCIICNREYLARSKSDYLSLCPFCNTSGRSIKEKMLAKFIMENTDFYVKTTDRKVLRGCGKNGGCLELDIYIPDLNLAFEFNGNYWHKEGERKDIGYHDYKTKCCLERGIRLIHIWEDDWDNNIDKIKIEIKELLNEINCS